MTNYWGYSTLALLRARPRASRPRAATPCASSRRWCRRLHAAGHRGRARRRLQPHVRGRRARPDGRASAASTTASTTASRRERPARLRRLHRLRQHARRDATRRSLKLVMDSLRYWVDRDARRRLPLRPRAGARARRPTATSTRCSAFFDIIHQDPVLSRIKLIAEPWDLGRRRLPGRQLPGPLDRVERALPRHRAPLLARRPQGRRRPRLPPHRARAISFADDGRHPHASINFVTAHDGFTLRDLVSYEKKHNEANGEDNRDGLDDNVSQNCGVEGETERRARASRGAARSPRSLLATLFVSQGVPDARDGRRAVADAARQQQRRTARTPSSPGSTGRRGRPRAAAMLERRARRSSALRKRASASSGGTTSCAAAAPAGRPQGHHVAAARRRRDDGARTGPSRRTPDGVPPRRGTRSDGAGPDPEGDDSFVVLMNGEPATTRVRAAAPRAGRVLARRARHRRRAARGADPPERHGRRRRRGEPRRAGGGALKGRDAARLSGVGRRGSAGRRRSTR